jgi:hypothetical protein
VVLVRDKPGILELPLMSKMEAADRILDEVVKLRRGDSRSRPASADNR